MQDHKKNRHFVYFVLYSCDRGIAKKLEELICITFLALFLKPNSFLALFSLKRNYSARCAHARLLLKTALCWTVFIYREFFKSR